MNERLHTDVWSDVPWPTGDHRLRPGGTTTPAELVKADTAGAGTPPEMTRLPRRAAGTWAEGLRSTVRHRPLSAVAAAAAVGALIARVAR